MIQVSLWWLLALATADGVITYLVARHYGKKLEQQAFRLESKHAEDTRELRQLNNSLSQAYYEKHNPIQTVVDLMVRYGYGESPKQSTYVTPHTEVLIPLSDDVTACLRFDTEEFNSLIHEEDEKYGNTDNRTESCFPGVSKLPPGEEGEDN